LKQFNTYTTATGIQGDDVSKAIKGDLVEKWRSVVSEYFYNKDEPGNYGIG